MSTDPLVTLITTLYKDSDVTGVKSLDNTHGPVASLGLTSRSKTIQRLISIRCGKPGTLKGSDSASNRILCAVMLAVEEGIENTDSNDTGLPLNVLSSITVDKVSKAGGIRKKDFNDLLNKVRNFNVTKRLPSAGGGEGGRRNSTGGVASKPDGKSGGDSWKRKSLTDLRASTAVKSTLQSAKKLPVTAAATPSSPTVTFNQKSLNVSNSAASELGTLTQTVLKKIQVSGVQLHQPMDVLNLSKRIYLSYTQKVLQKNTQAAISGQADVAKNVLIYALCCLQISGAAKSDVMSYLTKDKSKSVGERLVKLYTDVYKFFKDPKEGVGDIIEGLKEEDKKQGDQGGGSSSDDSSDGGGNDDYLVDIISNIASKRKRNDRDDPGEAERGKKKNIQGPELFFDEAFSEWKDLTLGWKCGEEIVNEAYQVIGEWKKSGLVGDGRLLYNKLDEL
ncbi:hypothetical protein TrST_g2013 [Triparma strigata]|uniref:Uncharacterized protein n=1 Tax=Triparma strigata TaxID=1606541 RepID=A0A9W7BH69_9STRA|nr:hypothetical protein TrST_g2013 [Triparma strigata]